MAPGKYVLVWYIILQGIIYRDDTSLIFPKIMRCWGGSWKVPVRWAASMNQGKWSKYGRAGTGRAIVERSVAHTQKHSDVETLWWLFLQTLKGPEWDALHWCFWKTELETPKHLNGLSLYLIFLLKSLIAQTMDQYSQIIRLSRNTLDSGSTIFEHIKWNITRLFFLFLKEIECNLV